MVVVEITVVMVQLKQLQTTKKKQRNETHHTVMQCNKIEYHMYKIIYNKTTTGNMESVVKITLQKKKKIRDLL